MAELGYVHGSDMLVGLMVEEAFSPLGHSKTCTISNKAETKERAVKPTLAEKAKAANAGYDKLLELWEKSEPVTVRYAQRGEEKTKYREGKFLITSLEETSPSDDDSTYTISLENSGPVETKTVAPQG